MPEETIISEENISTDTDSTGSVFEAEEATPKKRIVRRRLRPKKRVESEDGSYMQYAEKKEINTVLSNLYEKTNVQEIQMVKDGGLMKTSVFVGLASVFALVLWAGFFILPSKGREESQVALTINGPTELNIGATSTYSIAYANNSNLPLKNVVLNAYFPEGFIFSSADPEPKNAGHNEWDLGTLAPYQKGMISVSGVNFGSLKDNKSWRILLNYQPENFNSDLQKVATLTTTVAFSPAKLSISGPDQITVGSEAKYTFILQKNTDLTKTLVIVPEVPENFAIVSSTPQLNKNKQWVVPGTNSTSTAPQVYTLTGKFTEMSDESSPVKGKVTLSLNSKNYEVATAQLTSVILKNDVSVGLAINGSVNDFDSRPGEMLNLTITVKNSSQKEIKNASVKLTLVGPSKDRQSVLKWSDLVDQFDGTIVGEQVDTSLRRGVITWTGTNVPGLRTLKANDEVSIDIRLPIKDGKAYDLSSIKENFLITANAEALFKDATKATQSVATKPISITLNSDLAFTNDDDQTGNGAGEKHAVSWVLKNSFHPLKNIVITATTFGDVSYQQVDKAAGDLSYSPSENKITWTIPEMPDETDVLNSSFVLTLNKVNPTQTLLLSKPRLTALDTVTGKTITLTGDEISLR